MIEVMTSLRCQKRDLWLHPVPKQVLGVDAMKGWYCSKLYACIRTSDMVMCWSSCSKRNLYHKMCNYVIASGDFNGEVIVWHGETGESFAQPIKAHSSCISLLDFSPDGTVLVTGSGDGMTKLWNTKTWKPERSQIMCSRSAA